MKTHKLKKVFCLISPSFFYEKTGGSEIQNWYIANELIERKWEVHYIKEGSIHNSQESPIHKIILHSIPKLPNQLRWANIFRLVRTMRIIKARVWYCRGTISYLFPTAIGAVLSGGIVVWHCSGDIQIERRFALSFSHLKPSLIPLALLNRILFYIGIKHADVVIVQTVHQRKLLWNNYRLHGKVIHNAHPVYPVDNIRRKPVILWIGNIKKIKNPSRFVDLACMMRDCEYSFIMIGRPGSRELTAPLYKASETMPNFKYFGELKRDRVFSFLNQARLLVCTSDSEGFSNSFIEAWMHGVPTLSLKIDPDGIIRKFGLGSVSDTIEKMAYDLKAILENFDEWHIISQRCLRFALNNFDLSSAVDKIERIIASAKS